MAAVHSIYVFAQVAAHPFAGSRDLVYFGYSGPGGGREFALRHSLVHAIVWGDFSPIGALV
jgi:hypothetical protein